MTKQLDRRFKRASDDFDRSFNRAKNATIAMVVGSIILGLGFLGLLVWGVVMLLRYLGGG